MVKFGLVLGAWTIGVVGGSGYLHHKLYGVVNPFQIALSFFLAQNLVVCTWEWGLGLHIKEMKKVKEELLDQYRDKGGKMGVSLGYFTQDVKIADLFRPLKFWAGSSAKRLWATYAMYDPSYQSQESFGFFVDVGNGITTFLPSLLWLVAMTRDGGMITPQWLGIVGVASYWQELYGTLVYWLSYVYNKRWRGQGLGEQLAFVLGANGIWVLFPAIGLYVSSRLINDASFAVLRK